MSSSGLKTSVLPPCDNSALKQRGRMRHVAVASSHIASSADVVTTANVSPARVSLAACDIRAVEENNLKD